MTITYKYKYLFFVPSPRSIPEVKDAIVSVLYNKFDVIWFKYFKELDAYRLARDYFLNSEKNYDYLCIIPDDLIINEEGINELISEIENPSITNIEKYPVLAGICNLSYVNSNQQQKIPASRTVAPDPKSKEAIILWEYFLTYSEIEKYENKIIQCLFIGFPCEFIHRSVLEKIPFKHDNKVVGLDSHLSYDLERLDIPQFIDTKARFLHLKGLSNRNIKSVSVNPDLIDVGKYKPFVYIHTSPISK